ncbi:hypothetical protein BJ546DRAFT_37925 [Cryomyces antarcticus]
MHRPSLGSDLYSFPQPLPKRGEDEMDGHELFVPSKDADAPLRTKKVSSLIAHQLATSTQRVEDKCFSPSTSTHLHAATETDGGHLLEDAIHDASNRRPRSNKGRGPNTTINKLTNHGPTPPALPQETAGRFPRSSISKLERFPRMSSFLPEPRYAGNDRLFSTPLRAGGVVPQAPRRATRFPQEQSLSPTSTSTSLRDVPTLPTGANINLPDIPAPVTGVLAAFIVVGLAVAVILYFANFPPSFAWPFDFRSFVKHVYRQLDGEENSDHEESAPNTSPSAAATGASYNHYTHSTPCTSNAEAPQYHHPSPRIRLRHPTQHKETASVPEAEWLLQRAAFDTTTTKTSFEDGNGNNGSVSKDEESLAPHTHHRPSWQAITTPLSASAMDFLHPTTHINSRSPCPAYAAAAPTPPLLPTSAYAAPPPAHGGERQKWHTQVGFLQRVDGAIERVADAVGRFTSDDGAEEHLLLPIARAERERMPGGRCE